MDAEKSELERKKDELITFMNSEAFDSLPIEEQLRAVQRAGQALIDEAREFLKEQSKEG